MVPMQLRPSDFIPMRTCHEDALYNYTIRRFLRTQNGFVLRSAYGKRILPSPPHPDQPWLRPRGDGEVLRGAVPQTAGGTPRRAGGAAKFKHSATVH